MAKKDFTPQLRAVHKKFFPANIVILCIALLAAFFQLFTPVFDIRIHVTGENLSPLLQQSGSEEEEPSANMMTFALSDVDFVLPIKIKPTALFKAATGSEQDVKDFFNSILGDEDLLEEVLDQIAPSLLTTGISSIFSDKGISEEQMEKYKAPANEVLTALGEGNEEEARDKFHSLAQNIAADEGKTLTDQEINDWFDKFKDAGTTEDGAFKSTELLKNLDGSLFTKPQTEEGTEPTAYAGGMQIATTTSEEADTAKSSSALATIVELLENPGEQIIKLFTGNNMGSITTLQTGLLATYLVLVGIPAFFWLLLAVFALLRLFTQYKKVRYFYIYLFCIWEGLLLLLANVGLKAISKVLEGSAAKMLASFGLKIVGSGIVTGCCCLALILLSMFWYKPLKRKLRKAEWGEYVDEHFGEDVADEE